MGGKVPGFFANAAWKNTLAIRSRRFERRRCVARAIGLPGAAVPGQLFVQLRDTRQCIFRRPSRGLAGAKPAANYCTSDHSRLPL